MGACMAQIFPREVDPWSSEFLGGAAGKVERGRSSGVSLKVIGQFRLKCRVLLCLAVCPLEVLEGRHQGLRNVASPVAAEMSLTIWKGPTHAALTHSIKSRSFRGSLRPGLDSTPLETSTAYGWTSRITWATFSGLSPPAMITRPKALAADATSRGKVCPVPPNLPSTNVSRRKAWTR